MLEFCYAKSLYWGVYVYSWSGDKRANASMNIPEQVLSVEWFHEGRLYDVIPGCDTHILR